VKQTKSTLCGRKNRSGIIREGAEESLSTRLASWISVIDEIGHGPVPLQRTMSADFVGDAKGKKPRMRAAGEHRLRTASQAAARC